MRRFSWPLAAIVLLSSAAGARADLAEYIKKDEPKYGWKLTKKVDGPQGTTYQIELVSQQWHDITWTHRLEVLSQRVEEALRRADAVVPPLPDGTANTVPWGLDALAYIDKRRAGGTLSPCPLPELFKALREGHADLPVKDFHDGLRRLHDRGALRLLPFTGPFNEMLEPEYALPDGPAMYYYVTR